MHIKWVKGLSAEDKVKRIEELQSYRTAFRELKKILEEDFKESDPKYTNSAWAYEQADTNGANRKLKEIIDLISL